MDDQAADGGEQPARPPATLTVNAVSKPFRNTQADSAASRRLAFDQRAKLVIEFLAEGEEAHSIATHSVRL